MRIELTDQELAGMLQGFEGSFRRASAPPLALFLLGLEFVGISTLEDYLGYSEAGYHASAQVRAVAGSLLEFLKSEGGLEPAPGHQARFRWSLPAPFRVRLERALRFWPHDRRERHWDYVSRLLLEQN